eukprot:TRINITY_DN3053_c0_g2_i1.p1 TRINITY_DN3053_c0_g2~~TRINITY_DN3053_c0_g2_i1.p1  ORF type:complete len:335 (+),score=41.26 TRINITY_DN3053_c0_g2_i1:191-1195(+)
MILKAALVAACACMACLALQTQMSLQPGSDHVGASSWQSSDLESAKARAQKFESPMCQRAKARPDGDLNWWKRSMLWQPLEEQQEIFGILGKKVLYIRNEKAGSEYMLAHMAKMFGENIGAQNLAPLKNYTPAQPSPREALSSTGGEQRNYLGQKSKLDLLTSIDRDVGQDWNVFTVVRDPIDVAIAAYLEISYRLYKIGYTQPNLTFQAMPCDSKVQANERFKSYLKTLRNGEKISSEVFHAYPQALKVDLNFTNRNNTFDLIADVDQLSRDLCGFSSYPCDDVEPPTDKQSHSHKTEPCFPDLSDSVIMKELCDLYQVDFECFGYTLPPACS